MKVLLKREAFTFTTNQDFSSVIRGCKHTPRAGQDGTWITDEVERAYNLLHRLGYAHSAEAWQEGVLVGGLYGIRLGPVFFGESMLSQVSHASKYAFISYVRQLEAEDVSLIDCQVHTAYLESLGARMIPRAAFVGALGELVSPPRREPASAEAPPPREPRRGYFPNFFLSCASASSMDVS